MSAMVASYVGLVPRQVFFFFWGGGVQKNELFWGNENFADIFLGSSQNWTSLGVICMYFRAFSYGKYTESGYFWGCKNFKYFFGVLCISDIFRG